jgi:uncharacterized protein
MTARETRLWRDSAIELRAGIADVPTIAAYGAVFNRLSQNLGGFVEAIDPGAFTDTLARKSSASASTGDIKSYWNHDGSRFLGRTSADNLTVSTDDIGLAYVVSPPSTTYSRDLAALVDARLVLGSSFTFRTLPEIGDSWSLTEQGFPKRTLLAVELFEVGPVSDPAYLATEEEGAGAALRSLAVRLNRRPEEALEAAAANELRAFMEAPNGTPDIEEQAADSAVRLDVMRRRLMLAAHRR